MFAEIFCMGEYSCSWRTVVSRVLFCVGTRPSERGSSDRIWNRSIVFFLVCLYIPCFFALPFEETYCEENKLRAAYTEGVYGLCRHPGVLWFAGAFLCMWGMLGGWRPGIYFGLMIFWNYLYIIFQDLWTFPRTFFNYREYQQSTPFLIPNGKSIRACMKSIRKRSKQSGVDNL